MTEPAVDPPRSHGAAPLWKMDDAASAALDADVLVPVGDGEALWIGFEPADDRIAVAVRVGVEYAGGGAMVDAVTGARWTDALTGSPQNYVVSPPQWSLYGIADGAGRAWPFARATGDERDHAAGVARLHLVCIAPRAVPLLPPAPAAAPVLHAGASDRGQPDTTAAGGAGRGLVPQPIYADPFGMKFWDVETALACRVLLACPEAFERRSGLPAPGPLDPADTYQGRRLP